jgi:hypothetical protein
MIEAMGASPLARALARIDALHAEDPARTPEGRPAELVYAERMTDWLTRLAPGAGDALTIAVRAQHLARWRSPRDAFPEGRVGYLKWRKEAGERHAEDVRAICRESGSDDSFAARVAAIVQKKARASDPEAQTLEDCACLVFLAHELDAFAAKHADEKVVDILRKSWAKMSPDARRHATSIAFSERAKALVEAALA